MSDFVTKPQNGQTPHLVASASPLPLLSENRQRKRSSFLGHRISFFFKTPQSQSPYTRHRSKTRPPCPPPRDAQRRAGPSTLPRDSRSTGSPGSRRRLQPRRRSVVGPAAPSAEGRPRASPPAASAPRTAAGASAPAALCSSRRRRALRCCSCCCSCCCCSCSCLAPVFDARGRRVFLAAREAQREVVWSRPNRVGSRTLQRAEDDPWKDARGPWSVSRGVLDVQLEAGVGDGGAVEDEREEEEEEDEEEA